MVTFSFMDGSDMASKIASLSEIFVAQRTFIVAISLMDTRDMNLETAKFSESLVALSTFVFTFSLVDERDMFFEIFFSPKALSHSGHL